MLLTQSKTVTSKTSLTVGTIYVVTELVDLTEGSSPGTETNIELNCLIIFVLEGFFQNSQALWERKEQRYERIRNP